MDSKALAQFHVTVTSAKDGTWQGIVEAKGNEYSFQSELQLLQWVMEQFPFLRPDVKWEPR